MSNLRYALITPARNEELYLDSLIRSVAQQTLLPVRWVIVSDGSTDRTDAIARSAAQKHPWISLLKREHRPERHFAGKAQSVNAGYASLAGVDFDLVGNLDADVTLPADYFEFLCGRFIEFEDMGVAGTPYQDCGGGIDGHSCAHEFADLNHVSGMVQLFRRRCFEEIGGYTPITLGAVDWVAVTTARMRGWRTRTFPERVMFHHRRLGTAEHGAFQARFRHGQKDFIVGSHPLWQVLRATFQMTRRPYIAGGMCLLAGYFSAWASRRTSPVPTELRQFHRREQMARLRGFVSRRGARLASGPAGTHTPD